MTRRMAIFLTGILAAWPALAQETLKKETLPTAESILAKYVEATGGEKAYAAAHNMVSTGSFSIVAQGLKGTLKVYASEPGLQYAVVDIPGVGKIEEGSNGTIAWEVSAVSRARIKSGDEGAAALRENALDAVTNWKKYYTSAVTESVETIDGKPCYRVLMTPKTGAAETTWYQKDSSLAVKKSAVIDSPMGKVPMSVTIGDYRKIGDLLLTHKIMQSVMGQEI